MRPTYTTGTPLPDHFLILTPTEEIFLLVINKIENLGYSQLGNKGVWNVHEENTVLRINRDESSFSDIDFYNKVPSCSELPYITLNDLFLGKPAPVWKMQLTDEYEAVVLTEGVKVGCQTISFDKFDALNILVDKYRLSQPAKSF